MSIYIDVSSAVHAKAGIGRYSGSLARALVAAHPGRVALFFNGARGVRPPAGLERIPARTVRAGYKPWRMLVWLAQLARVGMDRLVPGAELFHATEHLLPPFRTVPTVLTVHDMIFRMFPQHQKRLNYWYLNATMPLYCRRAGAIITVSECSKRDIITHYKLEPSRIHVVYEAAGKEFTPSAAGEIEAARLRLGLPEHYLLHVGTIEPRKNLTRLVEALQILRDQGMRVPLVVVGAKGWLYDQFFDRLGGLDVRDTTFFPGYVPGADLPLVNAGARAVVMPSVYEGFGLPVLEAMACGTPVICSNSSSLPEIGGDAARYFDAYDVPAMAESIRVVWTGAELRAEMRERGLRQASHFSWEQAAEQTWGIYQSLLR